MVNAVKKERKQEQCLKIDAPIALITQKAKICRHVSSFVAVSG